jgi:hypothetical protein
MFVYSVHDHKAVQPCTSASVRLPEKVACVCLTAQRPSSIPRGPFWLCSVSSRRCASASCELRPPVDTVSEMRPRGSVDFVTRIAVLHRSRIGGRQPKLNGSQHQQNLHTGKRTDSASGVSEVCKRCCDFDWKMFTFQELDRDTRATFRICGCSFTAHDADSRPLHVFLVSQFMRVNPMAELLALINP